MPQPNKQQQPRDEKHPGADEIAEGHPETPDPKTEAGAEPVEESELDPIEKLEAEAAHWKDLAHRSQADLENYRKRMAREKAEALKYANATLLDSLLPILDNFHLGLQAARTDDSSTVYEGMKMVLKQIEDFLKEYGVEEIKAGNAAFDPNLHEAVAHEHSDDVPEGNVLREIRKGYRLKDRLLRASNIVVSKGPAKSAGKAERQPTEEPSA